MTQCRNVRFIAVPLASCLACRKHLHYGAESAVDERGRPFSGRGTSWIFSSPLIRRSGCAVMEVSGPESPGHLHPESRFARHEGVSHEASSIHQGVSVYLWGAR